MDKLKFLLETLGVWLVCILPGIGLGRLLAQKGIVRDKSVSFSLLTLVFVLLGRLSDKIPDTWWYYTLITIIGFLSDYRYEYGNTWRWGRWWWLKGTKITGGRKKLLSPWLEGYLVLTALLSIMVLIWFIISVMH